MNIDQKSTTATRSSTEASDQTAGPSRVQETIGETSKENQPVTNTENQMNAIEDGNRNNEASNHQRIKLPSKKRFSLRLRLLENPLDSISTQLSNHAMVREEKNRPSASSSNQASESRLVKCTICNAFYRPGLGKGLAARMKPWLQHATTHLDEPIYGCHLCEYRAKAVLTVKRHLRQVHQFEGRAQNFFFSEPARGRVFDLSKQCFPDFVTELDQYYSHLRLSDDDANGQQMTENSFTVSSSPIDDVEANGGRGNGAAEPSCSSKVIGKLPQEKQPTKPSRTDDAQNEFFHDEPRIPKNELIHQSFFPSQEASTSQKPSIDYGHEFEEIIEKGSNDPLPMTNQSPFEDINLNYDQETKLFGLPYLSDDPTIREVVGLRLENRALKMEVDEFKLESQKLKVEVEKYKNQALRGFSMILDAQQKEEDYKKEILELKRQVEQMQKSSPIVL